MEEEDCSFLIPILLRMLTVYEPQSRARVTALMSIFFPKSPTSTLVQFGIPIIESFQSAYPVIQNSSQVASNLDIFKGAVSFGLCLPSKDSTMKIDITEFLLDLIERRVSKGTDEFSVIIRILRPLIEETLPYLFHKWAEVLIPGLDDQNLSASIQSARSLTEIVQKFPACKHFLWAELVFRLALSSHYSNQNKEINLLWKATVQNLLAALDVSKENLLAKNSTEEIFVKFYSDICES
eukprot:GHVP01001539.1.p1 GENE.GHVP01001539.1~~GHVP01001539.1.p1  ORF type:complete len:238 (+),score=34.82 GHVP01001539.1:688-1401(+)